VRRIATLWNSRLPFALHVSTAAAQKTMQLPQKGIVLNSNPGQGLAYKFTGLNSIKPGMITEATRNTRARADRFASDSGSRVGSIRKANQGVYDRTRGSKQRRQR
jgi:Uncharacterized protein conserved in bacteria